MIPDSTDAGTDESGPWRHGSIRTTAS
jgi:hypothetical protein